MVGKKTVDKMWVKENRGKRCVCVGGGGVTRKMSWKKRIWGGRGGFWEGIALDQKTTY